MTKSLDEILKKRQIESSKNEIVVSNKLPEPKIVPKPEIVIPKPEIAIPKPEIPDITETFKKQEEIVTIENPNPPPRRKNSQFDIPTQQVIQRTSDPLPVKEIKKSNCCYMFCCVCGNYLPQQNPVIFCSILSCGNDFR